MTEREKKIVEKLRYLGAVAYGYHVANALGISISEVRRIYDAELKRIEASENASPVPTGHVKHWQKGRFFRDKE